MESFLLEDNLGVNKESLNFSIGANTDLALLGKPGGNKISHSLFDHSPKVNGG